MIMDDLTITAARATNSVARSAEMFFCSGE
jgi:hypothetical protein